MPVRLKDIADDLNLSTMTISKVLRGQTDVSAATKERVLKRVEELNYRPNLSAASLRTGQSMTVGLILPSLHENYFVEMATGIDRAAYTSGYGLVLCQTQDDAELEQRQIEHLLARQVDALMVVTTQETNSFFHQISKTQKTPLIFLNRKLPNMLEHFIGVHEEEVGRIACQHLIDVGCKRIAYLRGPRTTIGDLRLNGFRQALVDCGLNFQPEWVIDSMGSGETEYRRGLDGMARLLGKRVRVDGIVAYTDMMAVGAMDAALERGLKIPSGVAFVGSGNDTRLCEMRVSLSSLDMNGLEIGNKAARMAFRLMSDPQNAGIRKVFVTPRLVKRDSTSR